MYRRPTGQMVIEEFILPFEGKLDANNHWVKLAKMIPWEKIETKYADLFPSSTGTVAKPLRMALGTLIIKKRCGFLTMKRWSRLPKTSISNTCLEISDSSALRSLVDGLFPETIGSEDHEKD